MEKSRYEVRIQCLDFFPFNHKDENHKFPDIEQYSLEVDLQLRFEAVSQGPLYTF